MKIDRITPSPHIVGRVLVFLEDGQCLKITEQELLDFGLRSGDDLDDQTLSQLQSQADTSHVQAKGAALIGKRAMSSQALLKKLQAQGAAHHDATHAVEWLEAIGALDDRGYAATLVRHYSAMGYGRQRLKAKLQEKDVPRDLWDEALEEAPEPDDQIQKFIAKKLGDDANPDMKTIKKVSDALMRRGFSWSDIKQGLDRYKNSVDD
ncbi:regulatory protein RecX [Bengtsoniella intestinalis]|uniref:regulatory protein RecX n=1 Tax=Bengtsoniella intestinalis TaxID=3073143 RepID=UPI00391F50D4